MLKKKIKLRTFESRNLMHFVHMPLITEIAKTGDCDKTPRKTVTNVTTKLTTNYRKIPKISPGAYIFSIALFEGLIFGRKSAFQNRLG